MKLLTIGIILLVLCLFIGLCGTYLDKPLREGVNGADSGGADSGGSDNNKGVCVAKGNPNEQKLG